MCIIVVKPSGEEIPDNITLERCFMNNPDGAGMMFREGDKVHIEKGFMTPRDLIDTLQWMEEDIGLTGRDVVFHFRLATHGEKSPGCTHPFPLSKNIEDLTALSINTRAGIAHNGILYQYAPGKGSRISDTMVFVRDMAHNGIDEKTHYMMKNGRGQKFCLLAVDHLFIYGDFLYEEGLYFSNNSYSYPMCLMSKL